mgnify:CR=1 FL=1
MFIDENIFPQTLAVITTRAIPQGIEIRTGKFRDLEFTDDLFACVLQYPNANGNAEDYREFTEKAHTANCKVAVAADIPESCTTYPPANGERTLYSVHTTFGYSHVLRWSFGRLFRYPRTNTNATCRDVSSDGRR